jgi:hypothetical protein
VVSDICFHIVDLVQNSAAAGARHIHVSIIESARANRLELEIADDGKGMDAATAARVQDPFFTTKPFKRVGLGIPLLKSTSETCHGEFGIASAVGQGTTVTARMEREHIDCPPLGNLAETMLQMLVGFDYIDLRFTYTSDAGSFNLSSDDIRAQIGDLHFSHPDVMAFLRGYIDENLKAIQARAYTL